MLKGLTNFIFGDRREFEAFQIEASTYSSLECQLCARSVFAEKWVFRNMSLETFQKIRPHIGRTRWVTFRGWGDPLENENLPEMLRQVKGAETRTALITNGSLLSEACAHRLLQTDLDLMVINLEVATQAIQDSLSSMGSDLKRILDQVETVVKLRKAAGRRNPAVKLSFPMTRLNMADLPTMVPLSARLGVDEVIFRNLDYLPEERWNILRTFYHESPTPAFEKAIEEIQLQGKKQGISFLCYPLKAEERMVCEADPPRQVFFSVDGLVAPCPYLKIPQKGPIPRIFMNQEYRVPQLFFGNVHQEDFLEIWGKESYRAFRRVFEDRRRSEFNVGRFLDTFSNPQSAAEKPTPSPPPPLSEECRTCYKAYGI
ncbi:MAG: SPASM domain-containing protein [Syntrophaceae bacterium]|nr:SPASM domain-containing protein [Syntrophaceae bacterium]